MHHGGPDSIPTAAAAAELCPAALQGIRLVLPGAIRLPPLRTQVGRYHTTAATGADRCGSGSSCCVCCCSRSVEVRWAALADRPAVSNLLTGLRGAEALLQDLDCYYETGRDQVSPGFLTLLQILPHL